MATCRRATRTSSATAARLGDEAERGDRDRMVEAGVKRQSAGVGDGVAGSPDQPRGVGNPRRGDHAGHPGAAPLSAREVSRPQPT